MLNNKNTATLSTLYKRARTPVWQIARRSSAAMTRYVEEGFATQ
jgi:hypothetical protein